MNKEKEVKDIYKDCKIKGGKGNFDGDLMIVYSGPKFENAKILKQISGELKISNNNIYATPINKDKDKGQKELKELLSSEIALVSPSAIWVVGNKACDLLNIGMPMYQGYAKYFPYQFSDFFVLLMPTHNMINKMPDEVKKKFWKRLSLFRGEWNEYKSTGSFPEPTDERRSDISLVRDFAEEFEYEYDKQLKGPNTYFMIFSEKAETHVFVLPTVRAKKEFEESIPFGVKFTQDEVKGMSKDRADKLAQIMKIYDGQTVSANMSVL